MAGRGKTTKIRDRTGDDSWLPPGCKLSQYHSPVADMNARLRGSDPRNARPLGSQQPYFPSSVLSQQPYAPRTDDDLLLKVLDSLQPLPSRIEHMKGRSRRFPSPKRSKEPSVIRCTTLQEISEDNANFVPPTRIVETVGLEEVGDGEEVTEVVTSALEGEWPTIEFPGGEGGSGGEEVTEQVTTSLPSSVLDAEPSGPPLPVAILFPGQGSEFVGMLKKAKDLPAVKDLLNRAKPILGYDVLDICLNSEIEKLSDPTYCQPALYIAGLAGLEKMYADRDKEAASRASDVAGMSIGEYTALTAAGVLSFEDGLILVKKVAAATSKALSKFREQNMVHIWGLPQNKVEQYMNENQSKGPMALAMCLASNVFVISGATSATETVDVVVMKKGAKKTRIWSPNAGNHSPLMESGLDVLGEALAEAVPKMKPPKRRIWLNCTGEAVEPGSDPQKIAECLHAQFTRPVMWEKLIRGMANSGIRSYFEVGPGKELTKLMKRISEPLGDISDNVVV